ncbi:hypothetical protein OIU79_017385 [Salix purpurea]|uniref:Uncharacterized protein n=1 Tax=Salix purpurea TaxID=77065 RepID=A0A9Q0WWT4_SALPP|nr:hypothetical protein OIU79_017385 [Salix purpurea]
MLSNSISKLTKSLWI